MKSTAPPRLEFAQLVAQYHAMVWRYLRLLGCESALAEDLTQETFLAVWQESQEERIESSPEAYLRVVARHKFIDEMRRQRRIVNGELNEAEQVWQQVAHGDDGAAWRLALQECLALLPDRPRQVLTLRYGDQRPIRAVAQMVGMKESGVKTLLGRVKLRLRECVERKVNRT